MKTASGIAAGAVAALNEEGRAGLFVLRQGSFPADPRQGIYVPAAQSGSYWQRLWDGIHGRPEWFGAITGDAKAASQNRAAIQACIDLCPTTLLSGGSYFVDAALHVTKNGTAIVGTAHTQTDQDGNDAGRTSRLVSTSASETIVNVGAVSPSKPRDLTETVRLEAFTVDRAVPPFTPAAGVEGAVGIALRWCVNCHLERVLSLNSARGFFYYGVVETYTRFCGALRELDGANAANDCFVGFHFDGSAPGGYNGGNASVYLIYCRAFPLTDDGAPGLTYSAGVRFDQGWVDCFIHGFESGAGIHYGIHGIGDGPDSATFRTEDLIVTNCVLDGNAKAGIRLEQAGTRTAVTISNCYMATSGACVILVDLAGAVTISGCQYITGEYGAVGLQADNVKGLRTQGNIYTLLREPIRLNRVAGFHLADTLQGQTSRGDRPAIALSDCSHGKIDCIIRGTTGGYTAGVQLDGQANSAIEVCTTGIDGAVFAGDRHWVVNGGNAVARPGPFGANCLASGIFA